MQGIIEKTTESPERAKRMQNAYSISIATGVIFALIGVSVILINRGLMLDISTLLVMGTSLVAFFSAWLNRKGQSETGILLVIAMLLLNTALRVFIQKGFAIPTGITNVILISTIASYTLSPKWIGRAIAVSFVVSLLTIVVDQYTYDVPTSPSASVGITISVILGSVYFVFVASQFSKFNLRTKLISGFLALSVLPLIVLGWLNYTTSTSVLEEQIKATLRESATSTATTIEQLVSGQIQELKTEASLGTIINYLLLQQSKRLNSQEERFATDALQTFRSKDEHILSYSLLDVNGQALLDTTRANANKNYKDESFFINTIGLQTHYLSGVTFQNQTLPVFYISVPVLNKNKTVIGVLVATYDASILQHSLEKAVENRASGTEYTFMLDDTYFVNLGHSFKPELLYKSYQNPDPIRLAGMQAEGAIKNGSIENLFVSQPEVVNALQGMGLQKSFQAPSWENNNEMAESVAARVENTNWLIISSQPTSAIAALTQNQTRQSIIASIIIMVVASTVALLASNFFTNPIVELTRVAEKISGGDFAQKAPVRTNDEIGLLASTFNKMTEEIQELVDSLERRVEERTKELEKAIQQSEKKANELQIISDIARYISTEKDLEKLLPLITQAVSEQFGFYHVGIFLLNDTKRFAILRAANSAGGKVMLERQHKLEVGQTGIVGNVTFTGAPRIALDTGVDAVYFNNPDLPDTHSEMAVPLSVRGEIIGALDVQSTQRNAFTNSDIFVLSLLADQIAIAIDNVRLLEETKKALTESQSVFREYLAEAWQTKSATSVMGYYQTITGGDVITKKTLHETEQSAIGKNKTLEIPIHLRGQSIGSLNVLLNQDKKDLTEDQKNVITAIAERLGLALENARLFEETSTRASREKLVTDITTKIRATNNPQEMIKTAMDELKRALGASHVEVIPKKPSSLHDR